MNDNGKVGIRRLKNEASRIVEAVREEGREYVVTRRGKPVAVIRPWRDEDSKAQLQDRAATVLKLLSGVAERVAATAGRRGAAAAVSRQRR